MIRLTRLRQNDPLYINPDHIERLEGHHDTVVHLLNGTEYVVVESPEEIVEQVIYLRARAIGLAARLAVDGIEASSAGVAVAAVDPVHTAAAVAPLPTVHRDDDADEATPDPATRDQEEG
jgi:uncharacterized protein YlzI (FlbEa/FlbD family)